MNRSEKESNKAKDLKIPESVGNFDRVIEPIQLDSAPIKLAKWKSRETGLSVVWAEADGPLVNGYFTVATEIFNDSGVPHTLEHLIFLGSEKYPYKGVLDSLANRSFATGTNAWTDTTHTAYTVTTAGSEGFLRLLPIYLDHILYATITSSGFTTEVYHINGKGEDAGVVYAEMQGRENSSADLMTLRSQREIYPETSAYRSETGGEMAALRVLTVDQIRKYHSDYYRPHNLQLIVTGKVDPRELLNVLQKEVEPSLIKHGHNKIPEGWKRPFLETASKGGAVLRENKIVEVLFPEEDESMGEIEFGWVGPNTNDYLLQDALDLLGTYLTNTAISPLAKKFIEIEEPLCTGITFNPIDAEKTVISAYMESVPVEHLSDLDKKFKDALAHEAENLDMQRMRMIIERSALKIANQFEVDPHETLATAIISNFLYGSDEHLVANLSTKLQRHKTLAGWSKDQWSAVFKTWLVDSPSVTVIGKPSANLADQLEADTKARLEATKEKYGPDGLKQLQETLEAAQKVNDTPYPDEMMINYPIPNVESIKWIEVESARADGSLEGNLQTELNKKDSTSLPYFIQFDHVKSDFITISVHLSPTDLPANLFKYLSVYLASFFSLPVKRSDGVLLPFDQVVKELDKETIKYNVRMGPSIGQTIEISFRIEKSKYPTMIGLLKDLLWGSEFDPERLQITVAKGLQNIPSMKRDGEIVAGALYEELLYSHELALSLSTNLFKKDEWVPEIMEQLKSHPQTVIEHMNQLREHLLQPSTMRLSVAGDMRNLQNPKRSWAEHFQKIPSSKLKKPLYNHNVLSADGLEPSGKAIVMSMPSIESSFAYHVAKGPQGFDHTDRPALAVAISVLNAMEGYLWKAIRGRGLAYGAFMYVYPESGHVCIKIYSSPDSWKAFDEAGRVIKDLISKKHKFDELTLESAKSSLAYTTAARESNVVDAAYSSFTNMALKGISKDASRELLKKTKDITIDQVLEAIEKYFLPIFDAKTSLAVVASSPGKAESTAASLEAAGYRVEQRESNAASVEDEASEMDSMPANDEEDVSNPTHAG
ncbi:zinc metalloprotease [Melampsora americana]|nr:zinc metalloprotease [Melampsora americana]